MLKINVIIILFYILERLLELAVSTWNKRKLQAEFTISISDKNESIQMKMFHTSWFFFLLMESHSGGTLLDGWYFYVVVTILLMAQILRWVSIFTLGKYWSVDVYEIKEHAVINKGPYAFIKHPNYLAVILEFIFLPILLGSYFTLVAGCAVNYFILRRRIAMEEKALINQSPDYELKFRGKNKLLI